MNTNSSNIMVTGQVIQNMDGTGQPGLTVTAMENAIVGTGLPAPIVLATAKTDDTGRFRMSVSDDNLRQGIAPDLFFNVYDVDGKTMLASTFDYVVWNGSTQEDITIKIRSKELIPPLGKNRVNAAQARKVGAFLTQSDFKGVMTQVKSQVGTSFGVLGSSIMDSISKIDLKPLKVSVQADNIVDNNVEVAGQNLTDQNIQYQVMDYKPGINKDLLQSAISVQPVLRPGESVNLYQEDGVVKYYSIVSNKSDATPPAQAAPIAPSSAYPPKTAPKAPAPAIDHSADIAKLKKELSTTKKNAAEKDKHIAHLNAQLEAIREEQFLIKEMFNAQFRQ